MRLSLAVVGVLGIFSCRPVSAKNVLDLLRPLSNYKQFLDLLETTSGVPSYYFDGHLTMFAPSNEALAAYKGPKNSAFLLNHLATAYPHASLRTVNVAVSEEESLQQSRLTSLLQGNPPLWVRRSDGDLFVNQAKTSLVLSTKTDSGKKQFVYTIDSVLEPLVPVEENNVADYVDIKAGDILNNTDKFQLGGYSISKYAQRLETLGWEKFPEFSGYGKFTFFIPVDTAFKGLEKGLIDEEVVRAHMIPNQVIFTKPAMGRGQIYKSQQYKQSSQEMQVYLSVHEDEDKSVKAESQTLVGNHQHLRGKVTSTILKGNIPVQNGVVHLIDKPLVILAGTLWEMIDPEKRVNRRYRTFGRLVTQNPEILELIKGAYIDDEDNIKNGMTLFIPTNAAFTELEKKGIDFENNPDLLGYHILPHTLDIPNIKISHPQNDWKMYGSVIGYPKDTTRKNWLWNTTEKVFIDGGGVGAEIIDANTRAKNGIIHQIDQVLGIPLKTVTDKLRDDPMMQSTYLLGEQEHLNSQLGRQDIKYTYIVPSDKAWNHIKTKWSSAYKVLFMGQFDYQSKAILERHLLVGEKLSLEQILEAGSLPTIRGEPLKFYTEEINGETVAFVENETIKARVIRPNLQCSNGYIHVIDAVVMKRRDVTLSGCDRVNLKASLAIIVVFLLAFN